MGQQKMMPDYLSDTLLKEASDLLVEERGAELLAELENLPVLLDEAGQPIGPTKEFDDRMLAMIRGYELGLAKASQVSAGADVTQSPKAKPVRRSFRRVAAIAAIIMAVTASLVLSVQGVRDVFSTFVVTVIGTIPAANTGVRELASDYDLSGLPAGHDHIYVPEKLPHYYYNKTVEFLDPVEFRVRLTYYGRDGGQLVIEEVLSQWIFIGSEELDAPRTQIGGYEAIVVNKGDWCAIHLFMDDYVIRLWSSDVEERVLRQVAAGMRPYYG